MAKKKDDGFKIIADNRKARFAYAIDDTLEAGISPAVPAIILRRHPDCHLFLDTASAALLEGRRPQED